MSQDIAIKVVARVRPVLNKERSAGLDSKLKCLEKSISLEGITFTFDQVFNQESGENIYHDCAHEIVQAAMDGYHGTIMTYGQTCSGKTYTISSLRDRAMRAVFSHIEGNPAREFLLRISYVELYNEKFQDLLGDSGKPLVLREDLEKNVFLENCTEKYITSASDVAELLKKGDELRQIAETAMNDASSRSHVIFRLIIESRLRGSDIDNSGVFVSNLNIIDLAGSEKTSENLNSLRFKEGCNINKSLMTLATVIRKLSEQETFIPFRDSKLTRYLQNALGGNSKTAIILTISPTSIEETLSTLQFGQSAKKIKNRPQKNEIVTDEAELKKSIKEIERLKECIRQLESSQAKEELEAQKKKKQLLTEELGSVLCVSSRNRRQTVCVPQLSRFKPIVAMSPVKPTVLSSQISMPPPNIPMPDWSPSKFDELSLSFEDYEKHFIREAAFQKLYATILDLQEQNQLLRRAAEYSSIAEHRAAFINSEMIV
ncbi:hypothetical protein Btru_059043 [Bulinus truncatus]|nr:hypothetical protein Btru_059043 [Bulinus truncatus]